VAYTASKHAVVGMTKVLAIEWAGAVSASMRSARASRGRALTEPWTRNIEMTSAREEQTPLGRLADPWEMVGPSIYMVADASNFMTGAR